MLTANSVEGYFREALESALSSSNTELTPPAQAYLVQLLVEFSRSEKAFAGTDQGKPVFALMLDRARQADPLEALRLYKHLGDSSLYLTGFFAEAVEREIVSRDYYVSVGESAYASAANLVRGRAFGKPDLFEELAERFHNLVELLEAMSLHGEKTASERLSDEKLLQLIDRYRRTGSREVLEALMAHGVVLRPGLSGPDDEVH